ncbi:MAG: ribonuclease HI family protein [Patescibacteria group bacterium]
MIYNKLQIFTDGGARGNPGPSGIGVVIWSGNELVGQYKKYIGEATNNQAEYKAVILALEEAKKLSPTELEFFLDSELVVKQLNREYKVKDKELAPLFVQVWNLSMGFKKVTFTHVPREKNKEADKLVNEAMDEATRK